MSEKPTDKKVQQYRDDDAYVLTIGYIALVVTVSLLLTICGCIGTILYLL